MTKSVMLCGGSVDPKLEPLTPMSGRRSIAFAAVNCQTCAVPLCAKLARLTVAGVLADR